MGIIKDYFTKRRLKRLEADLTMLGSKLNFNPRLAYLDDRMQGEAFFTQRQCEYYIWSTGNNELIREFYKSSSGDYSKLNYFWRQAPINIRKAHTGIPSLICSKMPRILFAGGLKTKVIVGDKEDDKKSIETTAYLEKLLDEMKIADFLEQSSTTESWSGHILCKLSYDTILSQNPIIECYSLMDGEVIKERGITRAIIFKTYYKKKDNQYRLDEIYSTNSMRDATIQYKLYKIKGDSEIEEISFDSLEETKGILEYKGIDQDGMITFNGLKGMLAFEKANKVPSKEFPKSNYGASDFEGSIDSFDAMDECFSAIVAEARDNRTIRFVPDNMIPKIATQNGTQIEDSLDDGFTTNFKKVKGDVDQQSQNKIDIVQIKDKTEEHKEKYHTYLTIALNNAGISPYSIGLTGLESINSSAESQQERNKVTLETRKAKLERWKPFLELIFKQILKYKKYVEDHNDTAGNEAKQLGVDFDNVKINVEFGRYCQESEEKIINNWSSAKTNGISSTEEAVKQLHPDWSADLIDEEVNKIRYEQGMSLDNPDNLPELNGLVGEKDGDIN